MSSPPSPSEIIALDARGHRCPVPTLRLQRALAAATAGQRIRLIADDPMARIDVPHFAASAACELISVASEGSVLTFELIKKA